MLGIIGGMGPAATADFYAKLIEETPAARDEDHIPALIIADPRLPSRTAAILDNAPSPLPALRGLRDKLLGAGATLLAMPCNTAHAWHDELVVDCPAPFVSIVEASVAMLAAPAGSPIGVVATRATLVAGIYERQLQRGGFTALRPSEQELVGAILPSILLVKQGQIERAGELLAPAVQALLDRGAAAVILGCTETPVALDAVGSPLRAKCVDSNRALARACVTRWRHPAAAGAAQAAALRSA